ncbi:MAG: peptidase S10 [Novosphingobium sp. 17-62-19]|uniref:S10 family peptidase n=1 Tax=Novosphingobium sp. 17-62-19 TaxID=1970406 RepID=UPI000BC43952|nr:peptidase S10 [Novosphingobium sp. 17-62-19]OZA17955.1 MAG: peptidase S10 [Novosphingobium sp. 17-62-19]HQS97417.1 peptidase S10 [Novosphingobium sp.]
MSRFVSLATMAALMLAPVTLQAADKPAEKAAPKADDSAIPEPNRVVAKRSGTFGGTRVAYTAIAGETYLKDKDGKPTAAIFSTTYLKDGAEPNRPVFFLFNGGPGSGSLWLHMGAFGPKRVNLPDALDDGAPPYDITDNPESLLDVADLVFIDPVGTGWSHALGTTDPKTFYGVKADAESIAQFIRLWLNEHNRWNAPKFLGGESYGTTRSAAVAAELNRAYNDVALNGVILISAVLDFGLEAEDEGNELQHMGNLPSYAAAAWYHNKLTPRPATVEAVVAEARAFASGPYVAALLKGNSLPAEERATVRARMAQLTGLSEDYLERANLRVSPGRFYKELLRDRGLSIGRLDARYTGKDYDNAGEEPDNDPSFYGIDASYPAAVNTYLRGDLGYKTDRSYVSIGPVGPWDWRIGVGRDTYVNVAPGLARTLRENSKTKVWVGQGWYDFATPFYFAEYAMNRPGWPQDRVEFHYYDAGHMMYVRDADRKKLSADLRDFIRRQK